MNNLVSEKSYRWVVLGIIMMGTFMSILDSSIVNVALPHMMSAFGVNRDKIEWISTAYMLSLAVSMTLVGWLVKRFGHKALYLTSLTIFTLGSATCAFAWSYHAMIGSRIIQAIGGGAIQPVGMAIVSELFEPKERGKALGIWGTGVMIGPAIGPTLGGYLSDWFNWRSIFSVNLPFGVITLLAGLLIMKHDKPSSDNAAPFDFMGFLFLSMALIGGLIAFADGQDKGWDSRYILTCFAFAFVGLVMFIAIELSVPHPLFDLRLFRFRNFSLGMGLTIFRAVGLFGGVFLLPIFLQNLAGYTTIQTGLLMMPGAIVIGIMMPIGGHLADRYGPRGLVTLGVVITGLSLLLYGRLDPSMTKTMIIVPQMIRGIGLALMMAPLITASINAVPQHQIASASSLLNISQAVGGAFGIALLNTCVTNLIHVHTVRLGEMTGLQPELFMRLARQAVTIMHSHAPAIATGNSETILAITGKMIARQASILGFDNGFMIAGFIVLASIPLSIMLKPLAHHSK
jgi:DHA2 family multidrug resistance protein